MWANLYMVKWRNYLVLGVQNELTNHILSILSCWTYLQHKVYKVSLKSSENGVISERQLRACAWFFRYMEKIDTQHGLHVTSSVNRLRPVERGHSAMEQRANIKFYYKLGKLQPRRVKCWCRCTGGKPWAENVFTKDLNSFAKGRKRLRMSHDRVGHRQVEPQILSRKCDKFWHKIGDGR